MIIFQSKLKLTWIQNDSIDIIIKVKNTVIKSFDLLNSIFKFEEIIEIDISNLVSIFEYLQYYVPILVTNKYDTTYHTSQTTMHTIKLLRHSIQDRGYSDAPMTSSPCLPACIPTTYQIYMPPIVSLSHNQSLTSCSLRTRSNRRTSANIQVYP